MGSMILDEVMRHELTDLRYVADNLRDHDVSECSLISPGKPLYALLKKSSDQSERRFVLKEPWGVQGIGGICKGQVWMVGTSDLDLFVSRRKVLQQGREYLQKYLKYYPCLFNYCSDDKRQLKAMKALGFTVRDTEHKRIKRIEICA